MKQKWMGCTARDTVTGLEGIVTGITEFLNGCVRVTIQPPVDKDGKVPDSYWCDADQCEVVDQGLRDALGIGDTVSEEDQPSEGQSIRSAGGPPSSTSKPAPPRAG